MPGSFTISGSSAGDGAGSRTFNTQTISGPNQVGVTLAQTLASGDNVFNVPAGSVAVLVEPPSTASTLKFRTSLNGGDAGLPLNSAAQPFLYVFPAVIPTTVTINASALVASILTLAFI